VEPDEPESRSAGHSRPDRPERPDRWIAAAAGLAGLRLDTALGRALGVSRAAVRRLLGSGAVRTRERPGDAWRVASLSEKGRVLAGDEVLTIAGFERPEDQRARSRPGLGLAVLDRGPGWLAVDKPAGMPVHPLEPGETDTALGFVAAQRPEVHGVGEGGLRSGVVHRLDVDTSGALLFATDEPTWQRLRAAFAEHRVAKTYRAVVAGELSQAMTQRLGLYVARHRPAHVRVVEDFGARSDVREAVQRVEPIEALRGATLVEVRPVTGFLHQIRATLAHAGHPILGDAGYAPPEVATRAARQLLHAARVGFEEIEAHAPDPSDFANAVGSLRP
jgi:23S rRNA pseudouridine1911/1915/1917 synthase